MFFQLSYGLLSKSLGIGFSVAILKFSNKMWTLLKKESVFMKHNLTFMAPKISNDLG